MTENNEGIVDPDDDMWSKPTRVYPHADMTKRGGLKTWVKVALVLMVVALGAFAWVSTHDSAPAVVSIEGKSSNPADYPQPPWADDKRDETYALVPGPDTFWADVIKAPFPLSLAATAELSTDNAGVTATVIGGYASDMVAPPMSCQLPDGAILQQFGAKVDGVDSFMLLEYIGQDVSGDLVHSVQNECLIGTLTVSPVGLVFR